MTMKSCVCDREREQYESNIALYLGVYTTVKTFYLMLEKLYLYIFPFWMRYCVGHANKAL